MSHIEVNVKALSLDIRRAKPRLRVPRAKPRFRV